MADVPVKVVRRTASGEPNYAELDKPAVQRKQAVGDGMMPPTEELEDMLDIPAFLRRQAD